MHPFSFPPTDLRPTERHTGPATSQDREAPPGRLRAERQHGEGGARTGEEKQVDELPSEIEKLFGLAGWAKPKVFLMFVATGRIMLIIS